MFRCYVSCRDDTTWSTWIKGAKRRTMFCNMLRIWFCRSDWIPNTYAALCKLCCYQTLGSKNNILLTVVNTTREKMAKYGIWPIATGFHYKLGENCHPAQLQDEPSNALTLHRMDFCVLPGLLQLAVPDIAQQFLWSSMECVWATCRNSLEKNTCISCCFLSSVSALPSPITL